MTNSIELERSPGSRRVRLRLDVYNKDRQVYVPIKGRSVRLSVDNRKQEIAMFQALVKWLRGREWEREPAPPEPVEA